MAVLCLKTGPILAGRFEPGTRSSGFSVVCQPNANQGTRRSLLPSNTEEHPGNQKLPQLAPIKLGIAYKSVLVRLTTPFPVLIPFFFLYSGFRGNKSMAPLIWLITGATSGLGEALVSSALAAGDRVVATGRQAEERLAHLASDNVAVVDLDVSASREHIEAQVKKAWESFGRIDILVNNAGSLPRRPSKKRGM